MNPTPGVMIQSVETAPLYEKTLAMNEASVIGHLVRQCPSGAMSLSRNVLALVTGNNLICNTVQRLVPLDRAERRHSPAAAKNLRYERGDEMIFVT
jgi:hypothetical protein